MLFVMFVCVLCVLCVILLCFGLFVFGKNTQDQGSQVKKLGELRFVRGKPDSYVSQSQGVKTNREAKETKSSCRLFLMHAGINNASDSSTWLGRAISYRPKGRYSKIHEE